MDTRAELKRKYKETPRSMGVFQILNKANGKRLVGSSTDLPGVWNRHRFLLRLADHRNRELQRDWLHYGEENFRFEVLEEYKPMEYDPAGDCREELQILEELWLEKLQPYGEAGYNGKRPIPG